MSTKSKKRKQTPNGYTGYVSFPLLGTETYSEFIKLVQYYGDFVSEPARKQIFSKPRWFKMELWIAVDGGEFDITDISPTKKIDYRKISPILHEIAIETIKSLAENEAVLLDKSFFKISIRKNT